MHNGPLAVMDSVWPIRNPTGWYAVSRIRADGYLAPLVRCPGRQTDWCGEVESIDWSPDGTRLALSVTSFGRANPNGIHVINLGSGRDTMLDVGCCDWFDLDWSPDGTRLAYVTRNQFQRHDEIYIVEARRRTPGEAEKRHSVGATGPPGLPMDSGSHSRVPCVATVRSTLCARAVRTSTSSLLADRPLPGHPTGGRLPIGRAATSCW